jgi:hypothetical protein
MRLKLNRLLCFLALALPASAQLSRQGQFNAVDSAQLRAKFGAPSHVELRWPLSREVFRVPPGFDLAVDLTAFGHQVCKLQVPALMPTDPNKVQNTDEMTQKMYAFLAELVPDAMRGKEMGRQAGMTGAFSNHSAVFYEHVTITYSQSSNTITVQFKNAACQHPAAH